MEASSIATYLNSGSSLKAALRKELVHRCQKNPRYSLRSFARSLGVDPAALSQILNDKRPLTDKMTLRIGAALGLQSDQVSRLLPSKEKNSKLDRKYQNLDAETWAMIADWYHYAILELTYLKGFSTSPAWISRKLGITPLTAKIAVERLKALGLLKKVDGSWVETSDEGRLSHLSEGHTSRAKRIYQTQLLDLSRSAVLELELDRRSHTSATLCFDVKDLADAVQEIGAFRRKFAELFQPKLSATDVYQLQISFFPLTTEQKKGRKK